MEELQIKRNLPRDLFLHLLSIVTLYWSAVSFVALLWQYINYFFPDVLNSNSYGFSSSIRFAVSSLMIVFPVFIAVSWFLSRIYKKEAVVRESKIRKWLLYLTLFIASLVIIGDLVTTINMLLGGEVTIKFILKALSVLIVAGLVFGYYLDDVRRETPAQSGKYFGWGTGALVLGVIIGAFFIVGSPQTARLLQFDQQKIQDLQIIQGQIVNYWQRKEVLPNSLADLNDPISSYKIPNNPQTNQPYEYRVKDAQNLAFELCVNFNREGTDMYAPGGGLNIPVSKQILDNWQHPAGDYCFQRTIDKQLYPPLNKK